MQKAGRAACPFPRTAESQLHYDIRSAMQGSEFFACYMAPGGGVVALDRQGVTVNI